MQKIKSAFLKAFSAIHHMCSRILQKQRYIIDVESRHQKWWEFKLLMSLILPLAAMGFSIYFITVTPLFFVTTVIALGYKLLIAVCSYNSYKHNIASQSTSAFPPENPFWIRLTTMTAAIVFIFIAIITHLFMSEAIPAVGIWSISGIFNITITWFFETEDALISLYRAIPAES